MAGRGRPRKEDVIAKKEAQARAEGKTYGELAAEEQRKAVKVQQDDGVVRTTMKDRIKHILKRSLAAHENVLREIKEDIQSHKQCIKTQQEEIEQRQGCIETHKQAIVDLENEYKEEEEFLKYFQG